MLTCKLLYDTVQWWMSSVVQRWVQAFLGNVFSTLVATTNGLERQHQKLKYSHLNDSANGSLTDLLAVIVQSYVPSCHRRYYLALLFCQSATRVATSIFASESHFQHVSFTEVWYILFAVLFDSSSSLEFGWCVYIAAENHSISTVYLPSACCHLLQLCMYNPLILQQYIHTARTLHVHISLTLRILAELKGTYIWQKVN